MTTRIEFTYDGWDCWYHPLQGWGAILSRKGMRPVIITRLATKDALIERIAASSPSKRGSSAPTR
jgi:hypothetical protein